MNATLLFQCLIILPFAAAVIIYLAGRISLRQEKDWGFSVARAIAVFALLVEGCLLYFAVKEALQSGGIYLDVGEITLMLDGVGLLLIAVVLFLGLMVTLFSVDYMAGEKGEEKFYALLLSTIGSIIGLGLSFDLFNLWIWFEAMAVSTFLLVAFYNDQPPSLEAGIKYLVQSAVGSTLALFGIALIFSQAGSTSFAAIWQAASLNSSLMLIGGILLIVGFGVKTALVPLHTWLPDAHSQAPSGISAMLSGVVIEAGMIAMLRSLSFMGRVQFNWGAVLLAFGCLNILVGNLLALRQTEVKRLLAYSSLVHVGYMLVGFGIGFWYGQANGAGGGFFHLMTHSLMKGLAFLAAGALLYALHLKNDEHVPLTLSDLNGASRKYPLVAFALSVALLALGGLPPLAGFMSKWQILLAGASARNTLMIIVIIFVGLNSVLSLGYYAPMVNRLYRRETSSAVERGKPIPVMMVVPLLVLVLALVVIGLWPAGMEFFTSRATASLLYPFFY